MKELEVEAMYKTIWTEYETPEGLKYASKRIVKSRRKPVRKSIDLAKCIDNAVIIIMHIWAVVLLVTLTYMAIMWTH